MKTILPVLNNNISHPSLTNYWCRWSVLVLLMCSFSLLTSAQNKVWDKTFGGDSDEQLIVALPTSDGGYILGGTSFSGKSGDKTAPSQDNSQDEFNQGDFWIIKLKADGSKAWDKTYGGNGRDELKALQQTSDGGYILGGSSFSGKSSDKSEGNRGEGTGYNTNDYWVVKLNADGSKAWDKTIGSENSDYFASLYQTQDGGYILGGTSYSGKGGDKSEGAKGFEDYWVVKLNANGNKAWDKTFGSNGWDYLTSVQQTHDGGYILGGYSSSSKSGDKSGNSRRLDDYWIIKLSSTGNKVWDKTIGGNRYDFLQSVQQTTDGGYILGGTSTSGITGEKSEDNKGNDDFWIVKLNAEGTKVWDKTIGGSGGELLTSIQETSTGEYILGGKSNSGISGNKSQEQRGGNDYWVVKLQADGTIIWDKTIGTDYSDSSPYHDVLSSVKQVGNSGYILGGYTSSGKSNDKSEASRGGSDYWIVKLDNSNKNLNQVITFAPIPDKVAGDAPFTISATARGNLPVLFQVVSGAATIKGNVITLTGTGMVTVKAFQPGNATYKSAEAIQTFYVSPAIKKWDKTFGGSDDDNLTAMVKTPDGGYLLGGYSTSSESGDKSPGTKGKEDFWILKTNSAGLKEWDKTYGGKGSDILTAIIATPDGGYLLGGTSNSGISGDKSQASQGNLDYWLIKIAADGTKVWDKTYGGDNDDGMAVIVPASDGGYLLGGSSHSGKSGDKSESNRDTKGSSFYTSADYWIIKIDDSGQKLWDKSYGGNDEDNLAALVTTPDNGFLIGGSSASDISGDKSQAKRGEKEDYWIVRIDAKGTKLWDKTYGGVKDYSIPSWCGPGQEECYTPYGSSILSAIVPTPDGGFLLGGSSNAEKGGDKSESNQGTPNFDWTNESFDFWVVKIDKKGVKLWDKKYGGIGKIYQNSSSTLRSIVVTPQGDYVLAGYTEANKGNEVSEAGRYTGNETETTLRNDYWIVKIDDTSKKLWDKRYGGTEGDFLSVIVLGSTGGYVLAGTSRSSISGDKSEPNRSTKSQPGFYLRDYWIVNIEVEENQPVETSWNMRYGGKGIDNLTSVIKTSNGGYLAGGYSNSAFSGDKSQASQGKTDFWIVKSDKNGRKLWDKRYGGSGDDYLNRIIQTQDGGYLLAGSSLSGRSGDKTQASQGDRDYWIVKVDAQGNQQWDKRYGGSGYDELKKVMQLATGEYILAGYSSSPVSGNKTQNSQGGTDYWLVKISKTGTQLWDKRYGGNLTEALGGIVLTSDGGFLLGGTSASGQSGDKTELSRGGTDFWLVRTDKNGVLLWDKTYGGSGQDEVYSVGRTGKNDFFISGQSDSPAAADKTRGSQGGLDFWFMKVTGTGVKVWDKRFGGTGDDELRANIQTQDGGYLLAGKSFSDKSGNKRQDSQGSSDYWIVKTDKDGMYQWSKTFGGSAAEELRAVIQTSDGGLLLGGRSDSGVSGDRTQPSQGGSDYWLVKVTPETMPLVAERETTEVEEPIAPVEQLQAYPNPFSERATIRFTLPETQQASVKVYDGQGNEVATLFNGEAKAKQNYQVEWKAANKPAGLYFLQLQTSTKKHQQKLLLTK